MADNKIFEPGDLAGKKSDDEEKEIQLEDFQFSGEISISSNALKEEIEYVGEDKDETLKGLVIILTGEGKGKTTAALGMALRATGWNRPLIFIQMMKKRPYGELNAFDMLNENAEIYQLGREEHVEKGNPTDEDIDLARRALKMARESMDSRQYDWVFVDEALTAMEYGLISEQDILDLISIKPPFLHLVLTGLGITPALIDAADCVTRCEKIKHHFDKGIKAQKSVEF